MLQTVLATSEEVGSPRADRFGFHHKLDFPMTFNCPRSCFVRSTDADLLAYPERFAETPGK